MKPADSLIVAGIALAPVLAYILTSILKIP